MVVVKRPGGKPTPIAVLRDAFSDAGDMDGARRFVAALTPLLRGPARPRKPSSAPARGEQLPLDLGATETRRKVEAWLAAQQAGAKLKLSEILAGALHLDPDRSGSEKGLQREVGTILRGLGWSVSRGSDGDRARVWTRRRR